jgi:hypothetical protein
MDLQARIPMGVSKDYISSAPKVEGIMFMDNQPENYSSDENYPISAPVVAGSSNAPVVAGPSNAPVVAGPSNAPVVAGYSRGAIRATNTGLPVFATTTSPTFSTAYDIAYDVGLPNPVSEGD